MPTLHDKEFGDISVRRSPQSQAIRIKITPDGMLRISAPAYSPMLLVRRFLEKSRHELRELLHQQARPTLYTHGMKLGRSHKLLIEHVYEIQEAIITKRQRDVRLQLPHHLPADTPEVQRLIQAEYKKILRKEAKAYLPRRLMSLSKKHGFRYTKIRYSHASSRWGSCSSTGTISLNIALMKLPIELIDYVLIHELCHTEEMNHSQRFWQLVEDCHPAYNTHRKLLKQHDPYV